MNKEELNARKEEVDTLKKKLTELSEDEIAQVTGGLGYEKFNVVKNKVNKLYADGKISSKQRSEIIMGALQKNEESYKSFANKYARVHGLSPDDIML